MFSLSPKLDYRWIALVFISVIEGTKIASKPTWLKPVLFYAFFLLVPFILISPSLKKDWALLDDPDTTRYSITSVESIFQRLDFTDLYPPVNRYGPRFHPGFYLYRGILAKTIGLDPFVNHLWNFLLLYIHLIFMHAILFSLTRRYLSSVLGICLYLFFCQPGWSTAYYNWYSLMTFEPLLLILLVSSLAGFHSFPTLFKKRGLFPGFILFLSILALGFAFFTKEICFVFTALTLLLYLISRSEKYNVFGWDRKRAFHYFIGSLVLAILFIGVYIFLKSGSGKTAGSSNYILSPGHLARQAPIIFFKLYHNYTLLILIFPSSFILRLFLFQRENRPPGKREIAQIVFLFFGSLWLAMLLPWNILLERLFLIPTWCFAVFAGLEMDGTVEMFLGRESRLEKASRGFTIAFTAFLSVYIAYFIFGRLVLSVKIYALLLKILVAGFLLFIGIHISLSLVKRGRISRPVFGFAFFLFAVSFLFFLFTGSVSAFNFNHKYDGIEGVLVRMVRRVAIEAMPEGKVYIHLPEGHMYIAEMNFRFPLFDKRPDIEALPFSGKPGDRLERGDLIVHHPWLSSPKEFPFFKYEGRLKKLDVVKIAQPHIKGAAYNEFKRRLIARFTFPRDPRVRFLEKETHRNWWEIYQVLSETLTVLQDPPPGKPEVR